MKRGRFQGVRTIVRFNWPLCLTAGVVAVATIAILLLTASPAWRIPAALAAASSIWFLLGSLGASHWIYDRSDLYRWRWLREITSDLEAPDVLVCHTGFDEVSAPLRETFPTWNLRVLDHYDPALMTEASIRRARKLHPPRPDDLAVPFDDWSGAPEADLILAILSIHELRSVDERAAWFAQARDHLKPGGRIILAEHLRDPANFVAFGPGFVHFHSEAAWRRSWQAAGLKLDGQRRITPFIRILVLLP